MPRRLPEGATPRQEMNPVDRDFTNIILKRSTHARLLIAKGGKQGLSFDAYLNKLQDAYEAPPPEPVLVPAPVPWGAVLDAIRSRFGAKGIDYHKLEEALRDAGMPE